MNLKLYTTSFLRRGTESLRVLSVLMISLFSLQQVVTAQSYCPVTSTNTSYGVGNFTTTGGFMNINNTTGSGTYSDYSATQIVSQYAGGAVNFSITSYSGTVGMGIWVDWNGNYIFEASEKVYSSGGYVGIGTGSITVPDGTANGSYRMRVVANWLATSPTPCGDLGSEGYGEAEDYTFMVSDPPACLPVASVSAAVSGTSVTVTWPEPSTSSGNFEYVVSTSNQAPTEAGTPISGNSVTMEDLEVGNTYYAFVRMDCGDDGYSLWVGTSFYVGYCLVTSTNTSYGIGTFNTTGGFININNTTGSGTYNDYSATQIVSQYAGGTVNFSMSSIGGSAGMGIWVDWNNNYIFETSEKVYGSAGYVTTASGTITSPDGIANGNYRMRVVANYLSTNPTACGDLGSLAYGEAEDYTFMVSDPPACLPVTSVTAAVSGTSVTVTWPEPSTSSGNFEYVISTSSQAPTEAGTPISGTTVTVEDLIPGNAYYAFVRMDCGNDGYSLWVSTSFYIGYCQVTSTNTSTYGISNFTTTGGYVNINNTTSSGTYTDYSATQFVSQSAGESVNFSMTSSGGTTGLGIWIDWNNDLDFNDAGEQVYASGGYVSSGSGTITVPTGTPMGSYRMRVVANGFSTTPTPCGNLGYAGYGEAEDYTFMVTDAPECMPVVSVSYELAATTATINWIEPSSASGNYEYVVSTSNQAPTEAGTPISGTSVTVEDLIPGNTYYAFVRMDCGNDGYSLWVSTSFFIGYCQVTSGSATYGISNFSTTNGFTNINNSSGNNTYTDYTDQTVSTYVGASVNFSITGSGSNTFGMGIWIDWNNNFQFEASEQVFFSGGSYINSGSGTITVPANTPLGDYRMRVVANYLSTNPTPCGNLGSTGYGEAEDYTFVVIAPPACAPPTGISATLAQNEESTITWIASPSESATGYEWIIVAAGGVPTDTPIDGGTTEMTSAIAEGLEDFAAYSIYVRTLCGEDAYSAWAGPYNLPTPCTTASNGQYPGTAFIPTCNGTANSITTCAYASEYAVVNVEEGTPYTFTSSISSDVVTITTADGATVLAVGLGSALWNSTYTGAVRFYSHIAGCGSQSTCRVKTVICGTPWVNEASVDILYTLGGIPLVYGDGHVIQALISNPAADTWTKEVTLTISGANAFTDVYELTLSGGESQLISFAPFTPTNIGSQTVTVSVENDNVNSNNSYTVNQLVTNNLFSHKEPNKPINGAVGIGGGFTGNFVAKFTTAVPGDINEIKVDFSGDVGVSYQYRIFAADGTGGLPGTVLYESSELTTALGEAFLPVSPAVTVDGDFYVGLRELGTNFGFSYQDESPLRTGIYYFNTEDGTYPWTDIATSGAPTSRLAIEVQMFAESAPNCVINTSPANNEVICHMSGTTLSWASGGGSPTSYSLYFGTDEEPEFLTETTETSYEIPELTEGTTYYWYVIPSNEYGESECAEALSFSAGIGGCYCEPSYSTGVEFGDLIANVEILGTTLSNFSGTDEDGPAYTYYTGEPNYTAELQAGGSYTIVVSIGDQGDQNISVWIDFNDNGIFEENERVGYSTSVDFGGAASFTLHLPCDAPLGAHRMRIRDVWGMDANEIDPCANYTYGETEDYDITIIEGDSCPMPYNGIAIEITDVSAVLSWSAGCEETLWDVHIGEAGIGAPTGEASNPGSTFPLSVDGLTPFTNYEFWVRAICDDENASEWAGPFTFSTLLLPPPANDNPCGAIALTISGECSYVTGTNVDASDTPNIPTPSCSYYFGSDVWYTVVVPGNGIVTISTQAGDIDDAGMAVYSANSCTGAFTQIACNDDAGGGNYMPYLELTDLEPGSTLYIRIFSYGNFDFGTFGICATSPCSAPSTLDVVVSGNTATISWPSMGDEATYNWELRAFGDAGSGEDGLVQSGTTEEGETSITIVGLDYLSIYNFYISTNCYGETTSSWSGAEAVVTGALPGCTNPSACNYNPDAGEDDGSCIMEESTWYADNDGDGYGNPQVSQSSCEQPEGYVSNNTDCDDTNENVWRTGEFYVDADGDGHDNGMETVCYGAEVPNGYIQETLGHDCDDNNPNSWEASVTNVTLQLPITTICQTSAAFTLTGGSPAGGTWSGTGVTGSSFNPGNAGVGQHTITYSVSGDGVCTTNGSASAVIFVENCPGVEENSENDILLYPSHTTNMVNIKGDHLKEAVILDLNGRLLNTVSLFDKSTISMQEYSSGIYFVRVTGENKVKTFKVVRLK